MMMNSYDHTMESSGCALTDEPASAAVRSNLENLLERLEGARAGALPREIMDVLVRIEKELESLSKLYPAPAEDTMGSAPEEPVKDARQAEIDMYHNPVIKALAAICSNITVNARDIRMLNQMIAGGADSQKANSTIDRMLDNLASSDGSPELSGREKEILSHLLEGNTNREVSRELGISEKTVKNHLWRIYKKLGVENRTQLFNLLITT